MILQLLSPGYINQSKKFYELFRYFNTCSVIALFVVWAAEKNREKVETKRWFAKMYLLIHINIEIFIYFFQTSNWNVMIIHAWQNIPRKRNTEKYVYMTFCTLKTIKAKVLTITRKMHLGLENIFYIKRWLKTRLTCMYHKHKNVVYVSQQKFYQIEISFDLLRNIEDTIV